MLKTMATVLSLSVATFDPLRSLLSVQLRTLSRGQTLGMILQKHSLIGHAQSTIMLVTK